MLLGRRKQRAQNMNDAEVGRSDEADGRGIGVWAA